jgi:hypothetical protein
LIYKALTSITRHVRERERERERETIVLKALPQKLEGEGREKERVSHHSRSGINKRENNES